jgi:hypothetical protein
LAGRKIKIWRERKICDAHVERWREKKIWREKDTAGGSPRAYIHVACDPEVAGGNANGAMVLQKMVEGRSTSSIPSYYCNHNCNYRIVASYSTHSIIFFAVSARERGLPVAVVLARE